jgi:prepilin-type N-terminal cleavage/methylation domain-containing protein/prepilin-type processing-associated H-X9-DG protein
MARARRGFTLIELLVVMAIIGILAALVLPAVQAVRETSRRTHCMNNLRQVGLAVLQFELSNKDLPPGWISDTPLDRPGWGWATFALPFIEETNLWNKIDYNVQFSLPAMLPARTTVISVFQCPSDTGPLISKLDFIPEDPLPYQSGFLHDPPDTEIDLDVSKSNYSGVFGSNEFEPDASRGNGVFFRNSHIRLKEITDGLSHTIIVGERRGDRGTVTWVGVEPLVQDSVARIVSTTRYPPNQPDWRFEDFSSPHPAGVNFVFADGSTRLISNTITEPDFQNLATRNGGEINDYESY